MPPSGNMLSRTCEKGPVCCSCLPAKKWRLFADIFVSGRIGVHDAAWRTSFPAFGAMQPSSDARSISLWFVERLIEALPTPARSAIGLPRRWRL